MLLHLCHTWFLFLLMMLMPLLWVVSFPGFWRVGGNHRHICLSIISPQARGLSHCSFRLYLMWFHPLTTFFSRWYCHHAFLQSGWCVHVRRETALNHVCSLWQRCLWTVSRHGLTWGCSKRGKKISKSQKSEENCIGGVSFASSSFCHRNVVARLHFHWLKGPKCKLTQIIEAFALIKH